MVCHELKEKFLFIRRRIRYNEKSILPPNILAGMTARLAVSR